MKAIRAGHWPQAADKVLVAHVQICDSCREIALVVGALQGERRSVQLPAQLNDPGMLFWKAQLRRRNEAYTKIARPVIWVEMASMIVTFVTLAIAAVAWFGKDASVFAQNAIATGWLKSPAVLIAGAITMTVFGGVAVYLATSRS